MPRGSLLVIVAWCVFGGWTSCRVAPPSDRPDLERHTVRVGTHCHGVAVGTHTVITAAHCDGPGLTVDGHPARVVRRSDERDAMWLETTAELDPAEVSAGRAGVWWHRRGESVYVQSLRIREIVNAPAPSMRHGDSGSGLFDADGRLVAITHGYQGDTGIWLVPSK